MKRWGNHVKGQVWRQRIHACANGRQLAGSKTLTFCLENKHPGSLGPPCVANFRLRATHRTEICPSGLLCDALCHSLGLSLGLRCLFSVPICPFWAHKCDLRTMCCPKFSHHWVASASFVPNLCPYYRQVGLLCEPRQVNIYR